MSQVLLSQTVRKLVFAGLFLTLPVLCGSVPAAAADAKSATSRSGRRQAILIGVGEYKHVARLPYGANDVRQLATTLAERGGYDVLEIVDTARTSRTQSEVAAMQAKLKENLETLMPDDDVLLYFSGHGLCHKDKLYLALVDCKPSDPERTGLPAAWLREQLAACKAKFKLLIIDACHAGAAKSIGDPDKGITASSSVSANELALAFAEMESVVTLASSCDDEESLTWSAKRQSLFTYWLNQGLKGHADNDGDEQVSITELYDYVYEHVTETARDLFKREQTPVRKFGLGIEGSPLVISLRPYSLKGILDDMAEQVATAMQMHDVTAVGVPEFTADAGDRVALGAQFGTMGRYCADELTRRLLRKTSDEFDVIESAVVEEALAKRKIRVKDLRTVKAADVSIDGEQLPALALGTLRSRTGRRVTFQCKLVDLHGPKSLDAFSGTADLNDSELGMLGNSFEVPTPTLADADADGFVDDVLNGLDGPPGGDGGQQGSDDAGQPGTGDGQQGGTEEQPGGDDGKEKPKSRPHPMEDPDFLYRVEVYVGKEKREPQFLDPEGDGDGIREMYVALEPGDVYGIRIHNRSNDKVLLRLLVDGRNTLPEEVMDKSLEPESVRLEPAQVVNLDDAKYWMLSGDRSYEINGFYSKLGASGKYREFTVLEAPKSLDARDGFDEDIGIITAAFYEPGAPIRGRLMTIPGDERDQNLEMHAAVEVGRLISAIHIRYVDPEAFRQIRDHGLAPLE